MWHFAIPADGPKTSSFASAARLGAALAILFSVGMGRPMPGHARVVVALVSGDDGVVQGDDYPQGVL